MKNRPYFWVFTSSLVALLALLWMAPGNALSTGKKKERGYLGVSVRDVEKKYRKKFDLQRKEGVQVSYVVDDSPADFADLERNDIILEFNGSKLKSPGHLTRLVRKRKPGDKVTLKVIHDGKEKNLRVELTEYDQDEDHDVFAITGSGGNFFSYHFGEKPYLGVYLQDLNDDLAKYFKVDAESGVLITEVEDGSPAEDAGIKPGDILAKIDEEDVESVDDAMAIISEYEPEDEVEIAVIRSGSQKKMKVELDESPSGSNIFFTRPGRSRIGVYVPGVDRNRKLQEILEIDLKNRLNDNIRRNIERKIILEKHKNQILLENIRKDKDRRLKEIEEEKNHLRNRLIQIKEGVTRIAAAEAGKQTAFAFQL